jgi:TonB-dependent SusC/RagA subfamily outer membrane receptor
MTRADLERRLSCLYFAAGYWPLRVQLLCAPSAGTGMEQHGAQWALVPWGAPVYGNGFGDTEEAAFANLWANVVQHRREVAEIRRKELADAEVRWAAERERLVAWVVEGDASSAEIYGARAAYGVILITTKSGFKDGVNID